VSASYYLQTKFFFQIIDTGIVARQVLAEACILGGTRLDNPRQVGLAVLGALLILCRLAWRHLLGHDRLVRDAVHKGQSLHDRVGQVILFLVLIEHWYPVLVHRICSRDEGASTVDRSLFTLEVTRPAWPSHIRNLVPSVIDDNLFVMNYKIGVQKVFYRLDTSVLVWLLLDEHCLRSEYPVPLGQVALEARKQTVGVQRRYTRNIPLVNQFCLWVNQTHCKILDSDIDT